MSDKNLYQLLTANTVEAELFYPRPNKVLKYHTKSSSVAHQTRIINARNVANSPSLEKEGFCLMQDKRVTHSKWNEMTTNKVAEIFQEHLKTQLQCGSILRLGSIIRYAHMTQPPTSTEPSIPRPPAWFIHADWGTHRLANALDNNIRDPLINNKHLTVTTVKCFLNTVEDWGIYNIWLPLNIIINTPLALCDKSTIIHEDLFDIEFETHLDKQSSVTNKPQAVEYKPTHRWFYYPLMQCDEFLVFQQIKKNAKDSHPVFHSAFDLPNMHALGPYSRHSIEYRFLVEK